MSMRNNYPSARPSESHYFITISRGGRQKRLSMRPGALFAVAAGFPLLGFIYLAATAYLFFRDDMVTNLLARHARQQYAYEDRLAAMRVQLDVATSRQLLDQDGFEGRMQSLVKRQSQLEARTAMVASLSEKINQASTDVVSSIVSGTHPSLGKTGVGAGRPGRILGRALGANDAGAFSVTVPPPPDKPRPEFETRSSLDLRGDYNLRTPASSENEQQYAADPQPEAPAGARLEQIAQSLDLVEKNQVSALDRLRLPALSAASRLKTAIAEAGLEARIGALVGRRSAMGGPFTPAQPEQDATPFERRLHEVRTAFSSLETIRAALPFLPLRKPLAGALEMTSGYGYRTDPFLGRSALHSGLDFRADSGTAVLATAGGKVVTAGVSGGYGNLVEVDHGAGVSTRYGHLSAILVSEGETVAPSAILGRVGSTGRSTGPHLHYEVRLDDEAADPTRYLKAAKIIAVAD